MKHIDFNTRYFFWMLLLSGVLASVLVWPFLSAIFVAMVLAVLFQSLYDWFFLKTKHPGISSGASCIAVALAIIFPVVAVIGIISSEIQDNYQQYASSRESIEAHIMDVQNTVAALGIPGFDASSFNAERVFSELQNFFSVGASLFRSLYSGIVNGVLWLFVMFFTLFYLFIDGRSLVKKIMRLSPMRDDQEQLLIRTFDSITRATLKSVFVLGLLQGILGGIIFWITGVPSPMVWGVIMVFFSMIPMLGSGFVWAPIGLLMIFFGYAWEGIVILAFGGLIISNIDNILRPKLIGRDTEIHPLLVFFASLGGIFAFGIIGFLAGPIVMAFFLAMLSMYEREFSKEVSSSEQ